MWLVGATTKKKNSVRGDPRVTLIPPNFYAPTQAAGYNMGLYNQPIID